MCSLCVIILVDYKVTEKSFNFARKNHLPFYFVSASDGTNVVKVSCVCVMSCYSTSHVNHGRYLRKPLKQQLHTRSTRQISWMT